MAPKQVKMQLEPEVMGKESEDTRPPSASLRSHSSSRPILSAVSWLGKGQRSLSGEGSNLYQRLEEEQPDEGGQQVRPRTAAPAIDILSAPLNPAVAGALNALDSPPSLTRKKSSTVDDRTIPTELLDVAPEDTDVVQKKRSLVKLQRYVRAVIQEWLASCSPVTFRINDPMKPYPLPNFADHGMIQFPARADQARFIHLTASREPYRSLNTYCKTVLDLMEKHWQMEPASVLISITGGAQDFKLQPRLLKAFKHGLAKAAQATNAWVFTGGTDSGVMQLVGEALSETQCPAKMIGVVTWACVWGKERLEGCYGGTRDIVREHPNDRNHANLEPHHTHFILVDNGASPQEAFRDAIAKALRVPRWQVTLKVSGGIEEGKPPFHVHVVVSANTESEGTKICMRMRKVGASATSLSEILPSPSPVGEVRPIEYDPQTFASSLKCVLAPSVKTFHDNTQWGGEIEMRATLEKLYCERRRVPRVMVVVNGGPGTLTTVYKAVMGGCPVVIISDSGGIATCLIEFIRAYKDDRKMRLWEKRYESEYGKNRGTWEKMRQALLQGEIDAMGRVSTQEMSEIAEEDLAKKKVKSFALSETSTAALDLHLLNAVINDDTQIRAGSRLQLAVQWNRKEVVQSVMVNLRNTAPGHDAATVENYVRVQVAQALQIAIEREQADIIKMLFVQQEKAVGLLDFLSLYRLDHPLFATSAILQSKLAEGQALDAFGKPTTIALYEAVLLPFLREFIPGIDHALVREQEESHARSRSARAAKKATAKYFEDGLPHLMLWAVFIGSVELARVFWQQSTKHTDPIRLALIAAQVSKQAAQARPSAAQLYLRNADVFQGWAVSVLDKCPNQNQATIVLMRPSLIWPGTILQVAMDGENKSFVGHKYVQTLIDEYWRGNLYGSDGALPANVGSWRVLLHLFFKTLDKQPVDHDADEFTSLEERRQAKYHTQGIQISDLLAPARAGTEYYAPNALPKPGSFNARNSAAQGKGGRAGALSSRRDLDDLYDGFETANQALAEMPPCCQNPCRDGCICFPFRCFSCCLNCCFQCCTCVACIRCCRSKKKKKNEAGSGSVFRWINLRWFLAVPRVKFLLKMASYIVFMILYTLVLMSHPGTFLTFGMVEFAFCFYCYAFWVEELFQWYTHWRAGHDHFESFANIADVITLTSQVIASTIRLTVGVACHTAELGLHTIERVISDERRLGEAEDMTGQIEDSYFHPLAQHAHRFLDASDDVASASASNDGDDGLTSSLVWHGLYLGCTPLWMAQVVLAICAIYAYTRMLLWLQIYRDVGVLSIIIQALFKDIVMFGGILVVVMAAFASAFVALMPTLGDETFGTDGAFALPFWAMFGEFGDLHAVGLAGGQLGPSLLWIFSFTTQVVLVNLLIAMMSETYEKIKENADNEWKYSRVFVVDEFVSSVYWIPPPVSLPFLVLEMTHGFSKLACNSVRDFCVRCWEAARGCRRNRDERGRQLPSHPYSGLRRMSTTRATGLGYRSDAKVVPLLSDTLPQAVLETTQPDRMWLADVLEDEDRQLEGATDTKIERLSSELAKVLDKSLEIQESLMKLQELHDKSNRQGVSTPGGAPGVSRALTSLGMSGSVPSSPRASDAFPSLGPTPRGSGSAPSPSGARASGTTPRAVASGPSESALPAVSEGTVAAPKGKAVAAPPRTLHEELAAKLEAAEKALEQSRRVHVVARSQQNPQYPQRFQVPDDKVDWRVRYPEYAPRRFTGKGVVANMQSPTNPKGWADPADPSTAREQIKDRTSFEGDLFFDTNGRPVNPRGRTGICDRGMLGKWGPNHAADPIVTRWKPGADPPTLQVVAIRRGDTGIWALPGGMVDAGEKVSVTVRREFEEEAGNVQEGAEREAFTFAVEKLFSHGRVVYQGYVDDPRNTDNAWMETTAFHFHCDAELAEKLPLRAGDDARDVTWLDVSRDEPRYVNLYASHREWVDQVAESMGGTGVGGGASAPAVVGKPALAASPAGSDGTSKSATAVEGGVSGPPTAVLAGVSSQSIDAANPNSQDKAKPKRGVFGITLRSTHPRSAATPPPSPPGSPPG